MIKLVDLLLNEYIFLILYIEQSFVKQGGRFPIAVLAANRPDMLKQTLLNLLKVQGARKEDILIFQVCSTKVYVYILACASYFDCFVS